MNTLIIGSAILFGICIIEVWCALIIGCINGKIINNDRFLITTRCCIMGAMVTMTGLMIFSMIAFVMCAFQTF